MRSVPAHKVLVKIQTLVTRKVAVEMLNKFESQNAVIMEAATVMLKNHIVVEKLDVQIHPKNLELMMGHARSNIVTMKNIA